MTQPAGTSVYIRGQGWIFRVCDPCLTGACELGPECDCASYDGLAVPAAPWPPLHEGCFCLLEPPEIVEDEPDDLASHPGHPAHYGDS